MPNIVRPNHPYVESCEAAGPGGLAKTITQLEQAIEHLGGEVTEVIIPCRFADVAYIRYRATRAVTQNDVDEAADAEAKRAADVVSGEGAWRPEHVQ